MKKNLHLSGAIGAIFALCTIMLTPSFAQETRKLPKPLKNPTFAEVMPHLDKGGSSLFFINGEKVMLLINDFYSSIENLIEEQEGEIPEELNILPTTIKTLGIPQIHGIGLSSRNIAADTKRSRAFYQKESGDEIEDGLLWKLFPPREKPFALNTLPDSTVAALYGSLDLHGCLQTARDIVATTPAKEPFEDTLEGMKQLVDIERALKAMDGHWGIALTFHPEKTMEFPELPEWKGTEIPEPGIVFSAQLGETYLPDHITELLTAMEFPIQKQTIDGLDAISIPIPIPDLPLDILPTFVVSDNTLLIASTPELLKDALASSKKKNGGLAGKPDFQTYQTQTGVGSMQEVQQMAWLSPDVSDLYHTLIEEALDTQANATPEMRKMMEKRLLFPSALTTLQNLDDGLKSTTVTKGRGATMSVATVGIIAAILVPAVTKVLNDAEITRMKANGKNLYTVCFATALGEDKEVWPTAEDKTSTVWIKRIHDYTRATAEFYSGPHTEATDDIDSFSAAHNGWSVVAGQDATTAAGTPFLISSNLKIDKLSDPNWAEKLQPGSLDNQIVIVTHGAGARVIKRADLQKVAREFQDNDSPVLHP